MRRRRRRTDSRPVIHWRNPELGDTPDAKPRRRMKRAFALGVFGFVLLLGGVASALWLSSGSGAGTNGAQHVSAGNQPSASVAGSSVTLSWTASTLLPSGTPVSGYQVKRYNSSDVLQTIGPNCSGTVTALTCTETSVPNGTWKYSVTPVQSNWTGSESPKTTVSVAAPTVTSTNPSSRSQGWTGNVTVTGTNYQSGATVAFSGTGITVNSTTFNSSTQLTVNVTIVAGAATGSRNVTVTNPDTGTGSCTGCFTVTAGPDPTSVSPAALDQGGSRSLTITGTSFQSGATVAFSGTGITINSTTFNSSTQLTVNVSIAAGASLGARDVTVTNPDGGIGTCSSCFTVQGTPTVTSVAPPALDRFGTRDVTITGTNFVNGTLTASFGAGVTVNSVTYISATEATANLTIAGNAATGARSVTVTNSDGTTTPACSCFTVQAALTVASVSPPMGNQGGTNPNVIISGTNFVIGSMTATFTNLSGVTISNVVATSSTQATATIAVAAGAPTGNRNITLTNSDGTSASKNGVFNVQSASTITSTSPALGQGATAQNVTINGSNFVGDTSPAIAPSASFGSGITVNSVTFNATNKLTANVTIDQTAATGARGVTITNPDGTTGSCASCFTVNAGPKPTSVSPNAVGQGATNKSITINGTGFQTGGGNVTVTFSGSGVTSTTATNTAQTSTSITMNINVAANADLGTHDVTVTNKTDHGSGTCSGCITVDPAPTFAASNPVSPTSGTHGTTITMTISGSNFDSNVAVTFSKGGFVINSESVDGSGTTITLNVTLPGGAGATNITLTNPDGGTSTLTNGFTVT